MQVFHEILLECHHDILVDLPAASGLLRCRTVFTYEVVTIRSTCEENFKVRLACAAVSCRSIQTKTIGQAEILQEVVVQLELTIEALALVLIQVILRM